QRNRSNRIFFRNQNRFVAHWPLTEPAHQIYAKSPHLPQVNHREGASAATPRRVPSTPLTPSRLEGFLPAHPAQTGSRPDRQSPYRIACTLHYTPPAPTLAHPRIASGDELQLPRHH